MSLWDLPEEEKDRGYVELMVQGNDERDIRRVLVDQLNRGEENLYVEHFVRLRRRKDSFDHGEVYAVVIDGEGEALKLNPIDTTFSRIPVDD